MHFLIITPFFLFKYTKGEIFIIFRALENFRMIRMNS